MSRKESVSRFEDVDLENKKLPPIDGYENEPLVTLEEALQSVESLFNDLSCSIKEAKKYSTYPSNDNLSHDESAAIYLYTMDDAENSLYRVLNAALRSENRQALVRWFGFLRLFDEALRKLPNVKGNIWRGVPGNVGEVFRKGEVLTWWGINSCSTSLHVIEKFLQSKMNSTIFMIEAIQGKDVSAYSYVKGEEEVILNFGTVLRVKSKTVEMHGGQIIVHLEELNGDDVKTHYIKCKTPRTNDTGRY